MSRAVRAILALLLFLVIYHLIGGVVAALLIEGLLLIVSFAAVHLWQRRQREALRASAPAKVVLDVQLPGGEADAAEQQARLLSHLQFLAYQANEIKRARKLGAGAIQLNFVGEAKRDARGQKEVVVSYQIVCDPEVVKSIRSALLNEFPNALVREVPNPWQAVLDTYRANHPFKELREMVAERRSGPDQTPGSLAAS